MMDGIETVVFYFRTDDPNQSELWHEIRLVPGGAIRRDICHAHGVSESKITRRLTEGMRGSWRGRGPFGIRTYETVNEEGILAILGARPKVRTPESDRRCLEFEAFAQAIILPKLSMTSALPVSSGREIDILPAGAEGGHGTGSPSIFDDIMLTDREGDYWLARDLQTTLEYSRWEDFRRVVEKTRKHLLNVGADPDEHLRYVPKVLTVGNGASIEVEDFRLTKAGCYHIAVNADGSKPKVGAAKTYFVLTADWFERRGAIPAPPDGDQIELLLRAALDHRQQLRQLATRVEVVAEGQEDIRRRLEDHERGRGRLEDRDRAEQIDIEILQQEADSLAERVGRLEAVGIVASPSFPSDPVRMKVRDYCRLTGVPLDGEQRKKAGRILKKLALKEHRAKGGNILDYYYLDPNDLRLDGSGNPVKCETGEYGIKTVYEIHWMDVVKRVAPEQFLKLFPGPGLELRS